MNIRALTSGVLNAKILAFSTPNTKKLCTSHVLTFSIDEQFCSISRTIRWNAKKMSFLFFIIPFSSSTNLSLSLSVVILFLSHCRQSQTLPILPPISHVVVHVPVTIFHSLNINPFHSLLFVYLSISNKPTEFSLGYGLTDFLLGFIMWVLGWFWRLVGGLWVSWFFFFLRLWWVLGGEDVLCFLFFGGARFI